MRKTRLKNCIDYIFSIFAALIYPVIMCFGSSSGALAVLATLGTIGTYILKPGLGLYFIQILIPSILVCGIIREKIVTVFTLDHAWITFLLPLASFFGLFTFNPSIERIALWLSVAIYIVVAFFTAYETMQENARTEKEAEEYYKTHKNTQDNNYNTNTSKGYNYNNNRDRNYYNNTNSADKEAANASAINGGFFANMTPEEASKAYKHLIKKYHPDNKETGDASIAQAIIEEYSAYKKNVKG